MFPKENNSFQLLAYAKDQNQKKHIIKFINKSQYCTLKKIAKKLLNGDIHLTKINFRNLKKKKIFLRKLSEGKIKIKHLTQEHVLVCYIVKLGLEHYETRSKISTCTCRKVGENRRQDSSKRCDSYSRTSEEYFSSEESCFSDDEIEKSTRSREASSDEKNSDVSFSQSGEEE